MLQPLISSISNRFVYIASEHKYKNGFKISDVCNGVYSSFRVFLRLTELLLRCHSYS
jgi:hypothetical protein